jgi:hypothetical protein
MYWEYVYGLINDLLICILFIFNFFLDCNFKFKIDIYKFRVSGIKAALRFN